MKLQVYTLLIAASIGLACQVSSASKETPLQGSAIKAAAINKEAGIKFIEQDWDKALKAAHNEKKLVFLDIYATWCGPCKMLKQYTFSDSAIGEFFNKNFINVSVDGEKVVGPQLAQQYAIQGYPTLIVADETGQAVLYTAGYISAEVLMQFAQEALKRGAKSSK
jgi:thiol:disulfide interchange protein